jgi:hypothetical protein
VERPETIALVKPNERRRVAKGTPIYQFAIQRKDIHAAPRTNAKFLRLTRKKNQNLSPPDDYIFNNARIPRRDHDTEARRPTGLRPLCDSLTGEIPGDLGRRFSREWQIKRLFPNERCTAIEFYEPIRILKGKTEIAILVTGQMTSIENGLDINVVV